MSTKFLIKDGKYFIVPADFKGDITEDHGLWCNDFIS